MKPLVIFDLDGTLCDIQHRRHFVTKPNNDWPAFYAACVDDTPKPFVIRTARALYESGCEIQVWSGRSDEVRGQTMSWLAVNGLGFVTEMRMRQDGDYTPDQKLKLIWLESLDPSDRLRLQCVFDDRDRLVRMWRENGVMCFQVADGDF